MDCSFFHSFQLTWSSRTGNIGRVLIGSNVLKIDPYTLCSGVQTITVFTIFEFL